MTAVGIATVLSAEVGQVVFSLALATLGTSRSSRRLLYSSMAISTVLALTGSIQTALPGHTQSPFAWLEAVTREMQADLWYQDTEQEREVAQPFITAVEAITASSNGNGSRPKVSATAV